MSRRRQRANFYSNHEYYDMFGCICLSNSDPVEAHRMYQTRYPKREIPEASFFAELERRLKVYGSFHEVLDDNPNRPIEERIRYKYHETSTIHMRDVAHHLNISLWKVWHTIYNKATDSQLNNQSDEKLHRKQIAKFLYDADTEDENFLTSILWTGEAIFGKEGIIKDEVANQQTGNKTQDITLNVWMGINKDKLFGPFFLPDDLTDIKYKEFLEETVCEELHTLNRFSTIFQHDGRSEYFGHSVKDFLNERFPNKWIGKDGPMPWPKNSAKLSPLGYAIWPKMSTLVYQSSPITTVDELKEKIKKAAKKIQKTLTIKVVQGDMLKMLRFCVRNEGLTDRDEQVMGGPSSSFH